MRRKANSKDLAKRAKNLVRKWKQLVESGSASTVNGEGVAGRGGGAIPSYLPSHITQGVSSGSKPASPASRPGTPSSTKSNASPSLPSRLSRPDTPQNTSAACGQTNSNNHQSRLSPNLVSGSLPVTPASLDPLLARLKPSSPASSMGGSKNSSPGLNTPGLPLVSSTPLPAKGSQPAGTPVTTIETLSKGNAANKKRRRIDKSSDDAPSAKKMLMSHHDNSDSRDSFDSVKSNGRNMTVNGVIPGSQSMHTLMRGISTTSCDSSLGANILLDAPVSKSGSRTGATGKTPDHRQGMAGKRNLSMSVKTEVGTPKDSSKSNKTPKVKTTAQLIQELRASGELSLAGSSSTVSKIANNQIKRELDLTNASVVPPEAKPRPRKKPGSMVIPPSSQSLLEQTKKQRVEDFLQNSLTPSRSDLDLAASLGKLDPPPHTESPADASHLNSSDSVIVADNNSATDLTDTRPIMFFIGDDAIKEDMGNNGDEAHRLEEGAVVAKDPWSHLPPMNTDNIDWTIWDYPDREPDSSQVTEQDVHRLQHEEWAGVNGQLDYNDIWHDWTQTYSMPTYNGDLLHILPYVNIDDN